MANLDLWRNRFGSPFRELAKVQAELDRAFHDFGAMAARPAGAKELSANCEITEDKTNYMLKFDLPGVDKEHVKVEIDRNLLTVSAERREEKTTDENKTHYSEISYGAFTRSFTLPNAVDEAKVDAKFDKGVLTVTIPKAEASQSKRISVQ